MSEHTFQVSLAPWLVAVGDEHAMYVVRHTEVTTTSNRFQAVHDHAIDHRLVLDRTEEGPVEGMVYPTERRWYRRADAA